MLYAYPLDLLALSIVQPVHIAVDIVQPHVLVEVRLQICRRRNLALRMTDPCDDEMAQNAVPDYSKANSVVYVAEDNLWRVLERPLDARNGISRFLERLRAPVKVKCQLTGISVYPLTRLDFKASNLVGGLLSAITTLTVPLRFFFLRTNMP